MAIKTIKRGYRKQVGPACVVAERGGVLEIDDSAHGSRQRLTAEGADALAAAVAEAVESADVKDIVREIEAMPSDTTAQLCEALDRAIAEWRKLVDAEQAAEWNLRIAKSRKGVLDQALSGIRAGLRYRLTGE
jgi:cytochrome c5